MKRVAWLGRFMRFHFGNSLVLEATVPESISVTSVDMLDRSSFVRKVLMSRNREVDTDLRKLVALRQWRRKKEKLVEGKGA